MKEKDMSRSSQRRKGEGRGSTSTQFKAGYDPDRIGRPKRSVAAVECQRAVRDILCGEAENITISFLKMLDDEGFKKEQKLRAMWSVIEALGAFKSTLWTNALKQVDDNGLPLDGTEFAIVAQENLILKSKVLSLETKIDELMNKQ